MGGNAHITISPVAKSVPFDNSTNGFVSTDVQAAIEENNVIALSASPGFTWGRSGNVPDGTYLTNDSVPSNISGRTVYFSSAVIKKIFVANENATAGIVIGVYSHDGNEVNLTLLGTVTTAATRSNTFTVSFPIATNKQIAIRSQIGSPNGKNMVVGVTIQGTT